MFSKLNVSAIACILSLLSPIAIAEEQDKTILQFEYEIDAYYSNASWLLNFNNKEIPVIKDDDEENIYKKLITNVALPQYMLIEFSINPLPVLGTYIRKNHDTFYDEMDIDSHINLIQAITAGFEEPYALSLFFGSVVQYSKGNEKTKSKNKGYMGYLISTGNQHILNNKLIDDDWYELEWKIKGDLDFEKKALSWSLRIGGKLHSNIDIQDVIYFALRRNHFNNAINHWSWINNSDLEYTIELNNETGEVVQQQILVTKKWGFSSTNKQALNFGVGVIQQSNKYSGSLAVEQQEYRLIIRSNFQF